jgi:hypothetical protein
VLRNNKYPTTDGYKFHNHVVKYFQYMISDRMGIEILISGFFLRLDSNKSFLKADGERPHLPISYK